MSLLRSRGSTFSDTTVPLRTLPELRIVRKWVRVKPQANTAKLEVLVVLAEASAALCVEEDVAVFDPDVQPEIMASNRH